MLERLAELPDPLWVGGGLLLALGIGGLLHGLCWRGLSAFARRTDSVLDDSLLAHCRRPSLAVFAVLALSWAKPLLAPRLSPVAVQALAKALEVLLTLALAWLLIRLLAVAQDLIASRFDVEAADNLRARRVHTQFRLIRRVASVVIGLLAVAMLLASSESFRRLGAGILTSAGLLGLVVGFAAQ